MPPPPTVTEEQPAPTPGRLHTLQQQQLQQQIEAGLRLDRWALGILVTFVVVVLLAYTYQGWVLREMDRTVQEARREMVAAETMLRDLRVLSAGAPITTAGYFVVYRQQTVVYRRREHFNSIVARYNRTASLPYGAWWCSRLRLPSRHYGVSVGD